MTTRVQIYTSDLTIDPTIYVLNKQERNIVYLNVICESCNGHGGKCVQCGGSGIDKLKKHRVNYTRVAKMIDQSDNVIYESNTSIEKEIHMNAATKQVDAVDLKALRTEGEIFSKQVSFDHEGIKVEAHVLIANDKRSFRVFNTYNGTLGRKGKAGKIYELASDTAFDRKIEQLKKQGYKKR